MTQLVHLIGLGLISSVLCVVVRKQESAVGLVLSVAAIVCMLLVIIKLFRPIIEIMEQIRRLTGLSGTLTAPIMKAIGVSAATQFTAAVCYDANENSIGQVVEYGGLILIVYISLPVLSSVLDLFGKILGGIE